MYIWCVLTVRNLPLFRCHKIIWLQWFSCQQNNVTSWLPYQAGKGITRSATITAVVCLEQDSLIVLIKTSFKLSFLSLCSYIIHCACTERYNSKRFIIILFFFSICISCPEIKQIYLLCGLRVLTDINKYIFQ